MTCRFRIAKLNSSVDKDNINSLQTDVQFWYDDAAGECAAGSPASEYEVDRQNGEQTAVTKLIV